MQDTLFFNTGFSPIEILDRLYDESKVERNYYWSPAVPPVYRCDVSTALRSYFEKLINVPFRDCGFLRTSPNSIYPVHTDNFRVCALNMTMVDPNVEFETIVLGVEAGKGKQYHVDYVKNEFTILNVLKPHAVRNKSQELSRTILSIGFTDHDYATVLDLHRKNKLFNVTPKG